MRLHAARLTHDADRPGGSAAPGASNASVFGPGRTLTPAALRNDSQWIGDAMGDVPAVEIGGMGFSYGSNRILDSVDLTICQGEFVGVVGPNGGGKTTLLKLILGLLTPDTGTITVLGRPAREASREVGYVPQQFAPDPRFPMTLGDVVLMGRLGMARLRAQPQRPRPICRPANVGLRIAPPSHATSPNSAALIARAVVRIRASSWMSPLWAGPRHRTQCWPSCALNGTMTIILVTHDLTFVTDSRDGALREQRVRRPSSHRSPA